MPASTLQTAGDYAVAAAHTSQGGTLSLLTGVVGTSLVIICAGMPRVRFWMRQTTGAIGASFILQFSIDAATGGTVPVPNWRDLTPAQVLPVAALPGDPVELEFPALAATQIRIQFTAPAQALTVVDYVLAAAQ